LRPLPEKFDELETLLLYHRRTLGQSIGAPFIRLVYEPDEAIACQRHRRRTARVLEEREHIPVRTVSCRGAIFAHYEERGRLDALFAFSPAEVAEVSGAMANYASDELEARVLEASRALGDDGVIFLTDVAFLYPYVQLGGVLEACIDHIRAPKALVFFYPATVDVNNTLWFLGRRRSGYYRARTLQ
jgi:hypothetical protein